mmetsp:Transcript_10960/g.36356  ORF Transcript_10960/g.36356 Transcript_10960/m.36356 type:complete len:883 (-) Transcript_10960:263-2911(-)
MHRLSAGHPIAFHGGRFGTHDLPLELQPLSQRLQTPRKPSVTKDATTTPPPKSLVKRRQPLCPFVGVEPRADSDCSLTQVPASQLVDIAPSDPLAFVTASRQNRLSAAPGDMFDLYTSRLRSESLADKNSPGPLETLPNPYGLRALTELEAAVDIAAGRRTHSVSSVAVTVWHGDTAREVWPLGEWCAAWASFERVRCEPILRRFRARHVFDGWRANMRRRRNARRAACLIRAQHVATSESETLDPAFVAAAAMAPSVNAARELAGWIRLQSFDLEQVAGGADGVTLRLGASNAEAIGEQICTRVDLFVQQVATSLSLLRELLVATGLRALSEPNDDACRFVVETYGRKHYSSIAGHLLNRTAPLACVSSSPRNTKPMLPVHPPIGHARGEKGVERLARWHRELQPMVFHHVSRAVINAHMLPAIRILRGADWVVASALLEAPLDALKVLVKQFEGHNPLSDDFLLFAEVQRTHESHSPGYSVHRGGANPQQDATATTTRGVCEAAGADETSDEQSWREAGAGGGLDHVPETLSLRLVAPSAADLVLDLMEQVLETLSAVQLPSGRPELAEIVSAYLEPFGGQSDSIKVPAREMPTKARCNGLERTDDRGASDTSDEDCDSVAGEEVKGKEVELAAFLNEPALDRQAELAWERHQQTQREAGGEGMRGRSSDDNVLGVKVPSIRSSNGRQHSKAAPPEVSAMPSSLSAASELPGRHPGAARMRTPAERAQTHDSNARVTGMATLPHMAELLRRHLLESPPPRLKEMLCRLESAIEKALARAHSVAIRHAPFIAAASLPAGASQALAPPIGLSVVDAGCVRISGRSLWPNDSSNFDVNPLLASLSLEELAHEPPASLENSAAAAGSAPLWRRPRLLVRAAYRT